MAASTYTVQAGDTLSKIASIYGTSVSALAAGNKITDPNKISIGQTINLGGPIATPVPPVVPVNTMPATALGQNPVTYASQFPTPTASVGLAETATASKDAYLANAAKEADALTAEQAASTTQAKSLFQKLGISATTKAGLYESTGLNTDRKAIDELASNIESVGRSFDKQIETLQTTNPEGKLLSGVQNDVNRLTREKASTLADFAIVLNAKTRNYDTAKSIIDTKADAETEDLKTQLSGLQFFYQQNASTLSDDKRILLADKIKQADNEYQTAKELRTKIGDLQLTAAKAGAPVSVVQNIGKKTTLEDAMKAGGTYIQSKDSTGSFDIFTDEDKRRVVQSGLGAAPQRVQEVFLNTPAEFQQTYIRNGFGNKEVTPEILLKNLSEWEAMKKADASGAGDVNALVEALKSGG